MSIEHERDAHSASFLGRHAGGEHARPREILIVDDEAVNLSVLSKVLTPHFVVRASKKGEDALSNASVEPVPDLVLLDIMMPGMDGYEVLTKMRAAPKTRDIPVIFLSALNADLDEEKGLRLGAVDYITKPFKPAIVLERIRTHLELKEARDRLKNQNEWLEAEVNRRVRENQMIQDVSMIVIAQLAETRDADTANHVLRTRAYVDIIARRLLTSSKYADELKRSLERIVKASPLHDIGKIGIPDAILLKPGKLSPEEFDVMKTHCRIGGGAIRRAIANAEILKEDRPADTTPSSLLFLEEAETIAAFHHERWDGTGYPNGLKGDEIPLSARIMALADVFDALTSDRPYKSAWSVDEAVAYIREQRGGHFDPDIVDAFETELDAFIQVRRLMADD